MVSTHLHWLLRNGTVDDSNRRYLQKLQTFLRFTRDLSRLSNCKRRRVGCVIVPHDLTEVLSIGINGPSRGRSNDACTGERNSCGCVHAEANAVAKLTSRVLSMAICTCAPCIHCAGIILNVKSIEAVVFMERSKSNREGEEILNEAGGLCSAYHYDVEVFGEDVDDTTR